MAEQVLKLYGNVYITEDIIHNKIFMNEMVSRGFVKVTSIDEIPNGATVMFSAHGVSPQTIAKTEKKELTIIDGTCPIVKAIQNEVRNEADHGRKIVIIGNRSHAEIVALIGYANNTEVFVVSNVTDIDLLPDFSKEEVTYFTQTTLDYIKAQEVVGSLKAKVPHIRSSADDNICYATKERQDVVRKVAKFVDLIVVVGSSHSSNAARLREVALSSGVPSAILIDSKNDFNMGILNDVDTMAITSSASTPDAILQDLVNHLKSTADVEIEDFDMSNDNGQQ
jgi:4-hydroxy-3-methylbut-2-enyl diphosphate reductase